MDSHLVSQDDAVFVVPVAVDFRCQDVVAQVGHAFEGFVLAIGGSGVSLHHILRLVLQADQHGIGERVRTRHVLVQPFHREGLFGRLGHRAVLVNAVAEIVAIAVDGQGHGVAVGQAAVLVQGVVQALRLGGGGQAVDGSAAVGRDAAELHIHAIEGVKGVHAGQAGYGVGDVRVLDLDAEGLLGLVGVVVPGVGDDVAVGQVLGLVGAAGGAGLGEKVSLVAVIQAGGQAAQAEGVVLEGFHLLFEAGGDLLAIVLLELVGVEVDVQLADGVVAVRREGHILTDINGRGAVGERPATRRNDRHCGDGNEDLSGIVLFHFRILLCIIDCAAAVGAESDAVLDFFTAMCADHGVFPPVL